MVSLLRRYFRGPQEEVVGETEQKGVAASSLWVIVVFLGIVVVVVSVFAFVANAIVVVIVVVDFCSCFRSCCLRMRTNRRNVLRATASKLFFSIV